MAEGSRVNLDSGRFDAIVAGGGVYGILLALEGASRGQRVLLLERRDFGSGASLNHLRTIHGGLRYLQSLDLRRALMSNRERLWWLRTFPDLVRPITCLMPLYGDGLRRPEVFRTAFLLARMLGLARDGEGRNLPMRIVSPAEVRRRLPGCRGGRLAGGAEWHDAFMPRPHRLVAELLHWAERAGAIVRNRMELCSARTCGSRDGADRWRVAVRDERSGTVEEVASRWVVNAAGASVDEVMRRIVGPARRPVLVPTVAWGLLLDRPPMSDCSVAVAPPGRNRRTWFVHPYNGRLLAGTGHAGVRSGDEPPSRVPEALLRQTLRELNDALPGARFTDAQVQHVFLGVLPGVAAGSEHLLKHPLLVDHGRSDGAPGAFSVVGVKFTEAPWVAKRLWDTILGAAPARLPPRPPPLDVPTIEQARALPDESLAQALRSLAAAEWQPDVDDLLWRRTDLWMDGAQSARVTALMPLRQAGRCVSGIATSRGRAD